MKKEEKKRKKKTRHVENSSLSLEDSMIAGIVFSGFLYSILSCCCCFSQYPLTFVELLIDKSDDGVEETMDSANTEKVHTKELKRLRHKVRLHFFLVQYGF